MKIATTVFSLCINTPTLYCPEKDKKDKCHGKIGIKACIVNYYLTIKPLSFSKISVGRSWRIEYEGALYHLMSWGNNGQDIFKNDLGNESCKNRSNDID